MTCRSGQQILLGDRVVVKGERLGHVSYIGKLDFDIFDQIYIGVTLDMPGKQSRRSSGKVSSSCCARQWNTERSLVLPVLTQKWCICETSWCHLCDRKKGKL